MRDITRADLTTVGGNDKLLGAPKSVASKKRKMENKIRTSPQIEYFTWGAKWAPNGCQPNCDVRRLKSPNVTPLHLQSKAYEIFDYYLIFSSIFLLLPCNIRVSPFYKF